MSCVTCTSHVILTWIVIGDYSVVEDSVICFFVSVYLMYDGLWWYYICNVICTSHVILTWIVIGDNVVIFGQCVFDVWRFIVIWYVIVIDDHYFVLCVWDVLFWNEFCCVYKSCRFDMDCNWWLFCGRRFRHLFFCQCVFDAWRFVLILHMSCYVYKSCYFDMDCNWW